jgi:hypothetical protein
MNREEKMFPIEDPRFPHRVLVESFFSEKGIIRGLFGQVNSNQQVGVKITIGPSDPLMDIGDDWHIDELESALDRVNAVTKLEDEVFGKRFIRNIVLFFGSVSRASQLADCDWAIEGTGEIETKEGGTRIFQFRMIASPHRGLVLPYVELATDVPLLDIDEEP